MLKNIGNVHEGIKAVINHIISYIKYLENTHGLRISIHYSHEYLYILGISELSVLVDYNFHSSPFCIRTKRLEGNLEKCRFRQKRILKECQKSDFFYDTCHAGFSEYIRGVYVNSRAAAFISISVVAEDFDYGLAETLSFPLSVMLSDLLMKTEPVSGRLPKKYTEIMSYLHENYIGISLEAMSKELYMSKSYISHIFKKYSGHTIHGYCNILRVNDAVRLLNDTELSVTDIAYMTGFGSCGYFISTFKEIMGKTPYSLRKRK